jgi:hypothetical protein
MSLFGRVAGFVFAGVCLLIGLVWIGKTGALIFSGVRAEGTVVEVKKARDSDGDVTHRPIVEFTPSGSTAPVRIEGLGASSPLYRVGEHVPVVYRESAPTGATLHSVGEWAMPFIVALFGVTIAASLVGGRRAQVSAVSSAAFHQARRSTRVWLTVAGAGAGGQLPSRGSTRSAPRPLHRRPVRRLPGGWDLPRAHPTLSEVWRDPGRRGGDRGAGVRSPQALPRLRP